MLLCAFEYFLHKRFVYASASIIISFVVESSDITQMPYRDFLSKMVFRQWKVIGAVSKILKLQSGQVERLKPKLVSKGVAYAFVISADIAQYHTLKSLMEKGVKNQQLLKVCNCICCIFLTFALIYV